MLVPHRCVRDEQKRLTQRRRRGWGDRGGGERGEEAERERERERKEVRTQTAGGVEGKGKREASKQDD